MRSIFLGQKREARVAKTIAGGRGAGLCSWTRCRFRLDADVRVCGDPEGTPMWYYIIGIIVKGPHVPSSGTLSSRHLCEGHLPLTGRCPERCTMGLPYWTSNGMMVCLIRASGSAPSSPRVSFLESVRERQAELPRSGTSGTPSGRGLLLHVMP